MGRKNHNSFKHISHETRKPETKVGLKSYLIACEGECTEPNYINGLVSHYLFCDKLFIWVLRDKELEKNCPIERGKL